MVKPVPMPRNGSPGEPAMPGDLSWERQPNRSAHEASAYETMAGIGRRLGGRMVLVAQQAAGEDGAVALGFDPTVPNPARMWNYWLGGKDNYAADRELAARVQEIAPAAPAGARLVRRFLGDVVTRLAVEHGIRQFLDIGSGLPTADNTHEVARRAAPDARVVYVDHDPVVVTHARALLGAVAEEEGTGVVRADLRDVDAVLAGAEPILDLARPVAVLLVMVLHFIPDADDPWGIVRRLTAAVTPGSCLVIAHAASDVGIAGAAQSAAGRYNERSSGQVTLRTRDQVSRFFDGLEMLPPGLVPISAWWPERPPGARLTGSQEAYCGIGRKP